MLVRKFHFLDFAWLSGGSGPRAAYACTIGMHVNTFLEKSDRENYSIEIQHEYVAELRFRAPRMDPATMTTHIEKKAGRKSGGENE